METDHITDDHVYTLNWIQSQKRLLPLALLLWSACVIAVWCLAIGMGYRYAERHRQDLDRQAKTLTIPALDSNFLTEWNDLGARLQDEIGGTEIKNLSWRRKSIYAQPEYLAETSKQNEQFWPFIGPLINRLPAGTAHDYDKGLMAKGGWDTYETTGKAVKACMIRTWYAASKQQWAKVLNTVQMTLTLADSTSTHPFIWDQIRTIEIEMQGIHQLIAAMHIGQEQIPDETYDAIRALADDRLQLDRNVFKESDCIPIAYILNAIAARSSDQWEHLGMRYPGPVLTKTDTIPLPMRWYSLSYAVDDALARETHQLYSQYYDDRRCRRYKPSPLAGSLPPINSWTINAPGWSQSTMWTWHYQTLARSSINLHAHWHMLKLLTVAMQSGLPVPSPDFAAQCKDRLGEHAMFDPLGEDESQVRFIKTEDGVAITSIGADGEWDRPWSELKDNTQKDIPTDPHIMVYTRPLLGDEELDEHDW